MTKRKGRMGRPVLPPTPREYWYESALSHPDIGGVFTICKRRGCGNIFYATPTARPRGKPLRYCSHACKTSENNRLTYLRRKRKQAQAQAEIGK